MPIGAPIVVLGPLMTLSGTSNFLKLVPSSSFADVMFTTGCSCLSCGENTYSAPEVLSTARPDSHPLGADGLNTPSTATPATATALRIAEVKKVLTGRG